MRMTPLAEESSRQVAMPPAPLTLDTQQPTPEQVEPPAAEAAPQPHRNMLRRTSLAMLKPFGRGRASTVTGAAPTLAEEEEERANEYGSQVVDVLDVIGKAIGMIHGPS